VVDPEQLRTLLRAARDKDKAVYRVVKTKLDGLNAEAKRQEALKAHALALAETIERHSYKPFDGAFVATLEHLVSQWRDHCNLVADETRTHVESAIERAREVIAHHIRLAGMQAAREAAIANAAPLREAALVELRKLLVSLYEIEAFDEGTATNLEQRLVQLQQRWSDTLEHRKAGAEEARTFEGLLAAVRDLSQRSREGGTLPQQLAAITDAADRPACERLARMLDAKRWLDAQSLPVTVMKAEALVRDCREREQALAAGQSAAERQLASLIRKATQALSEGRSQQAAGMRRAIAAKVEHVSTLPPHLAGRLEALDAKLAELQDWKSYAVTPKRSELIEQMQLLIGIDEPPAQLAERIKRLQEEWRALAKGATDTEADWEKFQQAAQAAYQPCRDHFEAQAQVRAQNLERRKALVARLADYEQSTPWESVDWRNVANALRAAKQEWRNCNPTERAATRPIEQQFDESIARIQARLDGEYAANLERKQRLVKQAQLLAASTDLAQAATEVKQLQLAWRDIGLVPHAAGHALWEEFKQHCDAVFEKRRQQHGELTAALDANKAQALALCEECEALVARTGPELIAGAARLRELREQFDALGEYPQYAARDLSRRFADAVKQFERALAQQRADADEQKWANLFAATNRIRAAQLAGVTETSDALREELMSLDLPQGGLQALQWRLAQPVSDALDANEATLRALCIRAELATDTATPQADQVARRELQLQTLVTGFGHGNAAIRADRAALAFEWIACGPVVTPAYEALFERFERCLRKLGPQSS